jgi:acetyl-CoA carboxylase carboxyltransferase component
MAGDGTIRSGVDAGRRSLSTSVGIPRVQPAERGSSNGHNGNGNGHVARRDGVARVVEAPRRLTPRERIEALCDPGSVQPIRSVVKSRRIGERATEGDGVVAAGARIDGRRCFVYAQDGRFVGGSLGEAHADTIVRVLELAGEARVPVVSFVESAGARVQEAVAALSGYARIFRANTLLSGRVPQISVLTGASAGGGSYSPALTDFVVMTRGSAMFLTGPGVVRKVLGEDVSPDELGGTRVHECNGVCQFVAGDELDAAALVRDMLSYLPQNAWEAPPLAPPAEPVGGNPGAFVPRETRRSYDVRKVVAAIVDGGKLLEVSPRWARNMVVGFARIEGRSVGIVANQPRYLGGVIDSDAAQKAARFVRTCNAFGVPLVVLVDTPGFMPGTRQEQKGVIRHGAKLLHAFAEATVPRVTLVIRQAYGGAYITMNAKDLGADFAFAWPRARIGIMGAEQAVSVVHRRELEAADDRAGLERQLADEYTERHLRAASSAYDGFVDEVISPVETRRRLAGSLELLETKLGRLGDAGNIPL